MEVGQTERRTLNADHIECDALCIIDKVSFSERYDSTKVFRRTNVKRWFLQNELKTVEQHAWEDYV